MTSRTFSLDCAAADDGRADDPAKARARTTKARRGRMVDLRESSVGLLVSSFRLPSGRVPLEVADWTDSQPVTSGVTCWYTCSSLVSIRTMEATGSISRIPARSFNTAGARRFSSSCVSVDVTSMCTRAIPSNLRSASDVISVTRITPYFPEQVDNGLPNHGDLVSPIEEHGLFGTFAADHFPGVQQGAYQGSCGVYFPIVASRALASAAPGKFGSD